MARSSDRLVSIVALCLAGAASLACSSSEDDKGGSSSSAATCDTPSLQVKFAKLYSAFDGQNEYKVPAKVTDINGADISGASVEWFVKDPSIADWEFDNSTGFAVFTTKKAGETTVIAKSGSQCGLAPLSVTAATTAQWEAGSRRYNNGNALPQVQVGPNGVPMGDFTQIQAELQAKPPACTNCHGPTATSSFFKTVAHTPMQTGGFSDEELKAVVTQAIIPEGGYFSDIIPKQIWSYFHKWQATDEEAQGLVVFLRSLPPQKQSGEVDFGGFRRPGGTGGAPGAGGATGTGGETTSSGGTNGTGGETTSTGGTEASGGGPAAGGTSP